MRVEPARSGDITVKFGPSAITRNDKKGTPTSRNLKYVVTWKSRADGKRKVIADIWNTDK